MDLSAVDGSQTNHPETRSKITQPLQKSSRTAVRQPRQHLAVLDKTVVTPRFTRTVLDRVRLVVLPRDRPKRSSTVGAERLLSEHQVSSWNT